VSDEGARRDAEQKLGHLFEQHVREVPDSGRMIGAVIGTMEEQTVTVDQTVDERASGLVVGSYAVTIQSGRLVVRQKADIVEGAMIGAVIESLGGPPSEASEQEALGSLQNFLQWTGAPAPNETAPSEPPAAQATAAAGQACPNCGTSLEAGWKFCPNCQAELSSGPKYCTQCGAELPADAHFCSTCGVRVI
jgi:hypothetical protein